MLAIVDYDMGNLRSVQKAFALLNCPARIVTQPEDVLQADRLVLPGVGAFADAMKTLQQTGLGDAVRDFIRTGRPFLGICLGLQLLMEVGYEDGRHAGLGVIGGDCVRLTVDQPPWNLKVPHMGWNALNFPAVGPLFKNVPAGSYVYFVHSYHVQPVQPGLIAATTDYGGPVVAAICRDNVMATQFHPEKSQGVGSIILRNFAEWSC
jgi:glutamine amidotransferase